MADVYDSLSLSEVLSRTPRLEWPEAVAVCRALFAELTAIGGGARTTFPGLEEIRLSRSGELTFTGTSFAADGGRWAASVMQALLTNSEPPVQLRLLVTQASSAGANLDQLDDALAYFERPNRSAVLQNLYARALAAVANALIAPPTLKITEPPPTPKAQKRAAQKVVWGGRAKTAAVVALAVAVGAAGSWLMLRQRSLTSAGSQATSQVADAVGDALLAGVSKITETAGLGRIVPPDQVSPEATPAPAPKDIQLPQARRRPVETPPAPETAPPAILEFTAFDLADSPEAGVPAAADPASESVDAAVAPEDAIYSADSFGVAPPIGVRPQLARALPPTIRIDDLTALELVIATDGTVETARLVGSPRNVMESMIISAAKAWEFEPAQKDGRPVKYRKTVWIRAR